MRPADHAIRLEAQPGSLLGLVATYHRARCSCGWEGALTTLVHLAHEEADRHADDTTTVSLTDEPATVDLVAALLAELHRSPATSGA